MQAIGPYRVLERIGAGGMGEVFLAEDTRLNRRVALKMLHHVESVDDGTQGRRLLGEARAAAALNHPRIAAVYDVIESPGADGGPSHAYIVMEYVPGETLSARLRRHGRLPMADALAIAGEVAEALAAAHARGIIHRDLKPANIHLTPDGHVKVLDFGLAKIFAAEDAETESNVSVDGAQPTRTGQLAGTPAYMSPEHLLGRRVDHRTDIYALGVVLFEMIAGRRPFEGDDGMALGLRAITTDAPRLREIVPDVPAEIDALVACAMAKDAAARPQQASALHAQIAHAAAHTKSAAGVSRFGVTRARGARIGYAATAIVVVAAALVGVARFRTPTGPPQRPVIAVLPLANLSGDAAKDYLGIGIADSLTTHLARLTSVSVVARSGSESSKPSDNPGKIARDLGVNLVVQGSVQASGDRLHVNAKLVKPDGVVTWAGDAEAGVSDLFALESQLAGALVDALQVGASAAERQQVSKPTTSDRAALDAYWHGTALLERSDPKSLMAAIDAFTDATVRDPKFALAYAKLGEAFRRKYTETNDRAWITKALEAVSRAATLEPTEIGVRLSVVAMSTATGRKAAAIDELRQVVAAHPDNDDAHRQLGEILDSDGRHEEALAELQRAVHLRPQYWLNHTSLGLFYYGAGRLNDAVNAFARAAELRPDSGARYQQLGTAYQALGDNARARENYQRAVALEPNVAAYANLGLIQYSEARYVEAIAALEAAVTLRPKRALYRRNLGDAYLKVGRRDDARSAYAEAVRLTEESLAVNPSDATAMSQLAVYEAKLGHQRVAERHADGAVAMNPKSPEVLYRRAVVKALGGNTNGALKALSEAIAHGYVAKLAAADDDLAALRSHPEFRVITTARSGQK